MPYELKEGQGTLHKSTQKKSEKSPDYFGSIKIDGVVYSLGGWIKTAKSGSSYLSLAASLKTDRPAAKQTPSNEGFHDDDLDF